MAASGASAGKMSEEETNVTALKKKTEHAKKSEMLREIHKLEVQIQALERERLTHIFSKRSDFRQDFGPLEEEDMKMGEERKTEKPVPMSHEAEKGEANMSTSEEVKIKQQLEKMSHMVKRFHRELRDVKPTPEFVEKLKTIMEEIEGTINSFKEQQRMKYDDLMRSERTLFLELQQLEKKFETWNQATKPGQSTARTTSARSIASARDVTKDLPPEVAAFDKFVHQTGGHRGGWDEYDHQTFLKYRNMYKGRIVFLDHVTPFLPTRTETEIREHESWYQEYTFLNENKKYAIKKWREKKEEEKEEAITLVQEELETKKEEETKQRTEQVSVQEKVERQKQINAWKVQKELEKAMKEERKLKEELEKKKREEEERKRQLETKKVVQEFKQQKQLEEEVLEMLEEERKNEEEQRKREVIAKEIGRFRKRDMHRLSEKLVKEKEKEEKQKEKQKRLESLKSQVHIEAPRDPNRLLKPTAGWKERLKDTTPTGGGPVLNMPHRAVPSWRQGLH